MASGIVGVGGISRDKHRKLLEARKLYSHKNLKGLEEGSSQSPAASTDDNDDGRTSDDSSSQNLEQSGVSKPMGQEKMDGSFVKFDDSVTKFSAGSKSEIRELKRKLITELNKVRKLLKRLEAKEVEISRYPGKEGCANTQLSANNGIGKAGNLTRVNSEVGSVGIPDPRPHQGANASVADSNNAGREFVELDKGVLKSNQVSRCSDVVKRKKLPPSESHKNVKKSGGKIDGNDGSGFGLDKQSPLFKSCFNLLTKLMKHNYGWVFNAPVDVEGLGLHDYFSIISCPMDLGTVKTRLTNCLYKSPREFAENVRLTFQNAMKYNPVGQDVHVMADTLLKLFEKSWAVLENEHNLVRKPNMGFPMAASKKVPNPPPPAVSILPTRPDLTTLERLDSKKPSVEESVKRDMTYEEKQRLSEDLQNLPSEKLEHVVQIIRKRNSQLFQQEDEIEVDIDIVDSETLWELQEFVDSYKSSLNRMERKADVLETNHLSSARGATKEKKSGAAVRNAVSSSPFQVEKQVDSLSMSSS